MRQTKEKQTMKAIKIELTKLNDAQISDDFICIPLPPAGTGEGGIFHANSGRVYVDTVLWENDEVDDYGNSGSLQVSLSREERDAGEKGAYIGSLKVFGN